jgi:flagellar hook-associated protein 2
MRGKDTLMAISTDYVNALGAGSGLDTVAIVSAMVEAERAPKQNSIDRNTADVEAKVSGLAQVKSSLATLKTAFSALNDKSDFNFSALGNSQPTAVYAGFDGSLAQPGSYSIMVNSLAKAEIRQSTAASSSTDDLNAGAALTFTVQVGTGTAETITISAGNASLTNAATAINDLNIGVSAWVVEVSTGSYKMLMQGPTGTANNITITDSQDTFGLNSAGNTVQTSTNANIEMNGVAVSRASNVVDDLIPGVDLELMATTTESAVISITRDITQAQSAISKVVTAYNDFEAVIKNLTSALGTGDDAGSLKTDSSIKAIRETMRNFMYIDSTTAGANVKNMMDIGVSVDRLGVYQIDDAKLALNLSSNFDEITQIFSANTDGQSSYGTASRGIAGDLMVQIDDYLSSSGVFTTREASYTATQSELADDQTALDTKMEKVKARYTSQFSTMNRIMDEMKTMQEYLEGQLDNLPFTSKNN